MADRTQLQLFIHDCPDDQAPALVDVLIDWELRVDWEGPIAQRGELVIGVQPYTERRTALDAADELAAELIDAAPGVKFTLWTDPVKEFLGTLVRYTPELGRHDAECDAEGQGVYFEAQILAALRTGGPAVGAQAVLALVGAAWTETLTGGTAERTITYPVED